MDRHSRREPGDLFHVYDLVETRAARTSDRRGDEHRAVGSATSWVSAGAPAIPSDARGVGGSPSRRPTPTSPYAKRTWAADHRGAGSPAMLDVDDVESRQHVMCTNVFHQTVVDPADRRSCTPPPARGSGSTRTPARRRARSTRTRSSSSGRRSGAGRTASTTSSSGRWPRPGRSAGTTCWPEPERRDLRERRSRASPGAPAAMAIRRPRPRLSGTSATSDSAGARAYAATTPASCPGGARAELHGGARRGPHPRIAPGATGTRRVYAGGRGGSPPEPCGGASWETLPLVARAPYSRRSRDEEPRRAASSVGAGRRLGASTRSRRR